MKEGRGSVDTMSLFDDESFLLKPHLTKSDLKQVNVGNHSSAPKTLHFS